MNTSTKILLALLMQTFFISKNLQAQNTFPSSGSAGIGTTTPDASSLLEIKSTTKGLLMSRMTKNQRDAIVTPATGLMIYQTNSVPGFYYYSGTAWTAVTPIAKAWLLTGNTGTNPATDFIGTKDAQPLQFRVSNKKAGLIDYNVLTANTGFGFQSLNSNTGYSNSAFGYQSLFKNTTGLANMAIGAYALYNNTGDYNVASGFKALYFNTSGYANTATGYQALLNNTGGILNTGTGSEALLSNTTGSYNTATGYQALYTNSTGADNTATGLDAMHYNTTGSYNTATGRDALRNNTTGNYNTANGKDALYSNTIGNYNTATGWNALRANTSAIQNTANGFDALATNTTGEGNTATGYSALIFNTTGNNNTANGAFSLYNNTTGNYNTASGYLALNNNTTGTSNIAMGYQALRYNNTGSTNIAIGTNSLYSNTTGYGNTVNGFQALYSSVSGYYNTISGYNAGYHDAGAFYNTEIGTQAGYGVANGDGNTYVGYAAGPAIAGFVNSGAFGQTATPTASNQIRIGNSSVTSIGGQVGWTIFSDGRFKKNIKQDVPGLEFIKQLRPITYTLDVSGLNKKTGADKKISATEAKSRSAQDAAVAQQEKIVYTGFVAQEVEKTAKSLNYDFSGVDAPKNENDLYGLRYDEFVAPLVKAVQELSAKNDDLQKQIDELKAMIPSGNLSSINQQQTINDKQQAAFLQQNSPNPFTNNTVIHYYIPPNTNNAQLMISDVNGVVFKTIVLSSKGNGQATIMAGGLSQGNYFYTLLIDGTRVDTKQMEYIK